MSVPTWMADAAKEIANDPTCCDLSSSSAFQMLAVIAKHAPVTPRCDQCRWWESHGSVSDVGLCTRFLQADSPVSFLIGLPVVLNTRADFGCVQFEAKPAATIEQIAERIARDAHAGQTEESTGDDYVHHLERVVALVARDPELRQSERADAIAAAWLHDIIEDTDWNAERLLAAGLPHRVVSAVVEVTRVKPDVYAHYIEQIRTSGKPIAIAVKLADLRDHLRPNCPARLRPRYEAALAVLAPTHLGCVQREATP